MVRTISDKKVSRGFFKLLMEIDPATGCKRVETAICRAKAIYDRHPHDNFADKESSTSIFLLVKELLDMDLPEEKRISIDKLCSK